MTQIKQKQQTALRNMKLIRKMYYRASSCLPIPFILTNNKKCIFIIKNSSAIEFKFKDLIDIQMDWFYFSISLVANVPNPLLRIEHTNTAVKCIPLLTVSKCNKNCYTVVLSH